MYITSLGPLVLAYIDNTGNRKTRKTKGRCSGVSSLSFLFSSSPALLSGEFSDRPQELLRVSVKRTVL